MNKKIVDQHTVVITEFEPMEYGPGQTVDYSIKDQFTEKMLKKTKHRIVERALLDQSLSEMKIGYQGLVEIEKKKSLGKFTGANVILSGSYLIRENQVIVFAKLIEIETGKILWADASIKLKEYESVVKNITNEIKKNNLKKIAVLPIKFLGRGKDVGINYLSDVISVYVYQSGITELYERSNLGDLVKEIELAKQGLSQSEKTISLIPVEAFLGGYYYLNRDEDFDTTIELINISTSQIIWSEKIYNNNSNYSTYEKEISNFSTYIEKKLTSKHMAIKNIILTVEGSSTEKENILKKIVTKDIARHLIHKQKWKILDRDYLPEIKKELNLIIHDQSNDFENINKIGEIAQADAVISISIPDYIANLNANQQIEINTKLYYIESSEIDELVKLPFMDTDFPIGFSNKTDINFSTLPIRTAYWYFQSHSGTFNQTNGNINALPVNSNPGNGIGAMQFIYSYPKRTINTVLFANMDLNYGFKYQNLQNQDINLLNLNANLEWGVQIFDSYTITGGLGWSYLNSLIPQNNNSDGVNLGSFYPSCTIAYRIKNLVVAVKKFHYQFAPFKNNHAENIYDGLALIFGMDFGMNEQAYTAQ